jgi:ferredoxin
LRTLLTGYHDAGGTAPTLLLHDTRGGEEMISAIGRFGDGLPAATLPFAVNEVAQVGLDLLLAAIAYGATRVLVLSDGRHADRQAGLATQVSLCNAILTGLGYGEARVQILEENDPDKIEARLWETFAAPPVTPARFLAVGSKRDRQRLALEHLHEHAPSPVDVLALPAGSPFGAVTVDTAGCTLCLSCVGACPTGAMHDDPDRPRLGFEEQACVQCGLCRVTCPESVITLEPRLSFTEDARRVAVLHEEEPACCVRCDKPFGVASSIERMVAKLKDHAMFADNPAALDRIRMCEDCRVIVQFEQEAPMSGPPRPKPRTADDID